MKCLNKNQIFIGYTKISGLPQQKSKNCRIIKVIDRKKVFKMLLKTILLSISFITLQFFTLPRFLKQTSQSPAFIIQNGLTFQRVFWVVKHKALTFNTAKLRTKTIFETLFFVCPNISILLCASMTWLSCLRAGNAACLRQKIHVAV